MIFVSGFDFIRTYECITAELEKKLSELQKYVKNEGEPLPTWLQEDMERAGLSKTSSLSKVCMHFAVHLRMVLIMVAKF